MKSRPYRQTKRAEKVDETRQRIVDAAVHLHGTIGPAATTFASIAEAADVSRVTLYRHFPDNEAMFAACSTHWLSQQQLPDPGSWGDPCDAERYVRTGLADLYRYYRDGQGMIALAERDFQAMPADQQAIMQAMREDLVAALMAALDVKGAERRRRKARVGHAVNFSTWHSLRVENGLSDKETVEAMASFILPR